MKKIIMFLVLSLAGLISQPVFANMEAVGEHCQLMRQAATELQPSNPGLSKKLNDLAAEKEKWMENEGKEYQVNRVKKSEDLQRIKQASTELKATNDNLANDLEDIAGRWEKKMNEKEKHLKRMQ